ncbi:unnamed protein product [Paramecium primaurelia]|uniref:Uncharacterized protein n=1 Tax=Paramecium primaurelia TaxID=5886 RepID=A0A8S1P2G4_PARPR|nr:unnamed protein product [Paramecium primaurelia]
MRKFQKLVTQLENQLLTNSIKFFKKKDRAIEQEQENYPPKKNLNQKSEQFYVQLSQSLYKIQEVLRVQLLNIIEGCLLDDIGNQEIG